MKFLLKNNADIHAKHKRGCYTALICASSEGHIQIVNLLLAKGTHVCDKDTYGNTSLIKASNYGHLELVKLLYNGEIWCNEF